MACNLLRNNIQPIKLTKFTGASPLSEILVQPFPARLNHHPYHSSRNLSFTTSRSLYIPKSSSLTIHSALSSPAPPSTKEDAILQAKTSLSTTLQKPLSNPRLVGNYKKPKQPRFRIEIPVIDESPESIIQLALSIFSTLPIKTRGSKINILLIWANSSLKESAIKAFHSTPTISSNPVIEHIDLTTIKTVDSRILNSANLAVFLAPESSQLSAMKSVMDNIYSSSKPVVLFNPKWAYEEEEKFGELSSFAGSFDVVYAFLGLEVRGILSKKRGVVFKCVRDGILSGEKWNILVEEGDNLKVVSRFTTRPSMAEVENVLYNVMAINSPITKSTKFLKDLVSNVTRRK